jgi:hypothetical protein
MQHHAMNYWDKATIAKWLLAEKVCVRPDDEFRLLVHRTKRFTENFRNQGGQCPSSRTCVDAHAQLLKLRNDCSFAQVLLSDRATFDKHTFYVVPGCSDEIKYVHMWTTINFMLNLTRSAQWHHRHTYPFGPTAGVDHTFKVTARPAGAHRSLLCS